MVIFAPGPSPCALPPAPSVPALVQAKAQHSDDIGIEDLADHRVGLRAHQTERQWSQREVTKVLQERERGHKYSNPGPSHLPLSKERLEDNVLGAVSAPGMGLYLEALRPGLGRELCFDLRLELALRRNGN